MTLTGVPAVDVLVIVAVTLTALGVIFAALRAFWRKALHPIINAADEVQRTLPEIKEALPTLLEIAKEFQPNHGESLKDIVTQIREDGAEITSYAHATKHDTVGRLAALQGWQDLHGERLDAFMEETKSRFEALGAEVTTVKSDLSTVMTIIDRRGEAR